MKRSHKIFIISSCLIALLVVIPSISSAKENDNKGKSKNRDAVAKVKIIKSEDHNDNDDNREDRNKESRSCIRAWGHLIAPGWIKKNSQLSIDTECHLPFGIGKKFRGNNASTTPDVTAPVISAISFRPAKTQVEVRWTTDEKSDSTVFLSLNSPVDVSASATKSVSQNSLVKDHRIVLKNLTASTTYYVVIRSRDAAGNVRTSDTQSFMTTAPSVDTSVPTISNVVTLTSTSTVKIGWSTNEQTTGRVFYSTSLPVALSGSSAIFADTATTSKSQIVTLTGLNPNTTYYLVIEATDLSGNVSTSATFSAVTGNFTIPDTTAPVISAVHSTVGTSTANISWTTNESATSKVFYATSTPVNTALASTLFVNNSSLVTNHSLSLSGLATSTQYYLIITSTDAANNNATSSEFSITTGSGL